MAEGGLERVEGGDGMGREGKGQSRKDGEGRRQKERQRQIDIICFSHSLILRLVTGL